MRQISSHSMISSQKNFYTEFIFTGDYPKVVEFLIEKPDNKITFSPGGPHMAIGAAYPYGFTRNLSWDFAVSLNKAFCIFPGIGYETNFAKCQAIAPEIQMNCAVFGVKVGTPWNIHSKEFAIRSGLSFDVLLLGLSLDIDYLTKQKRFSPRIMMTFNI